MFTRRFDTGISHPRYFAPDEPPPAAPVTPPAASTPPPAPAPATPPNEPEKPVQDNEANMWRRKAETANARVTELEAAETTRKQAEMTEVERERAKAAEALDRAKAAEDRALRLQIAAETGLSIEILSDLNGADEATLRAQAERLAQNVVKPPVQAGTTTRPAAGQQPSIDEQITAAQQAGNTSEAIRLKREQAGFTTR